MIYKVYGSVGLSRLEVVLNQAEEEGWQVFHMFLTGTCSFTIILCKEKL